MDISIPLIMANEPEEERIVMILSALANPKAASSTQYYLPHSSSNTLDTFSFEQFATRLAHHEGTGLVTYWQEAIPVDSTHAAFQYWSNRFVVEHSPEAPAIAVLHPEMDMSMVGFEDGSVRIYRTTPTVGGLAGDAENPVHRLSPNHLVNGDPEEIDALLPEFMMNYDRLSFLIRDSLPEDTFLHDIPLRQQFELFRYVRSLDISEGSDSDRFRTIVGAEAQAGRMPARLNLLTDQELGAETGLPSEQLPRLRDFIRYHMLFAYMKLFGRTGLSILNSMEATPERFNYILDAGTAYPEFHSVLQAYGKTNEDAFIEVQGMLEHFKIDTVFELLPETPIELRAGLLRMAQKHMELQRNYRALKQRTTVLVAAAARLFHSSQSSEERAEYLAFTQDALRFEQSAFLAKTGFKYRRGATNEDVIRLSRFAFRTDEVRELATATVSSWLEDAKRRQKHMPYHGRVTEITDAFYTAFITMQEGNTATETTGDTQTEITRYVGSLEGDVAIGEIRTGTEDEPVRFGYIGIDSGQRVERHVIEHANRLLGEHVHHIGIDTRRNPNLIEGVDFFQGPAHEVLRFCSDANCQFDRLYAIWSSMPTDLLELELVEQSFQAVGNSLRDGGRLEIDFPFPYGEHSHERLVKAHQTANPYDVDVMATVGFRVGETEVAKQFLMQDPICLVLAIAEQHGLHCTNIQAVEDYEAFVRRVQDDDSFLTTQDGVEDIHRTPVWQTRAGKNRITLQFKKR